MAYVKLDTGILTSSLWIDADARTVFITALLMARPRELTKPEPQLEVRSLEPTGWMVPPEWYGVVDAAGIGIVSAAGIEKEAGLAALERLCSPDPDSRSQKNEGRRMARIDHGYVVLNYMDYRDKDHTGPERSKRYRERLAGKRHGVTVTQDAQEASRHAVIPPFVTHSSRQIADGEGKATDVVGPSPLLPLLPTSATAAAVAIRTEMDWRVEEVWRAHLKQWAGFFTTVNGKVPSPTPTLTKEIRGAIRDAIAAFDKHLLGAEQRDQWKRESKARAAGIGIFFDTWCTGTDPKNNVNEGGKRFLEHWRPWKKQAGKGDPVERFSELYFEVKSRTS